MDWYYASSGVRFGPVDDTAFRRLLADGTITSETLVWNADLPDWKAWGEVSRAATPVDTAIDRTITSATPPEDLPSVVCVECAGEFAEDTCVKIGGLWVCPACKPVALLRYKQDSPMLGEIEYAGFAPRFWAKIIDYCVSGSLAILPTSIVIALTGGPTGTTPQDVNPAYIIGSIVATVIQFPLIIGFQVYFLGKFGATPGKLVLGLRVVGADLQPISYARALGRCAAELISGATCNIGYLLCLYDEQRRTLHDHIAATRVIRKSGER